MKKNKRILIDCRNLAYPGTGLCSYIEGLLQGFCNHTNGIEFYFLVEDLTSIERLNLSYPYKIVLSGCRKSNSYLRDLFEQVVIPLKLLFQKIDVFHGVDYYIPFLPTPYKKITTIHDCAVFHEFEGRSNIVKKYCMFLQRLSAICSDRIVAISNFDKKEIIKYHKINENKITTILNGINEVFYKEVDKKIDDEVKKRLLSIGSYILYYGGYRRHKNVSLLLEAFSVANRSDLKLVLVGSKDAVEAELQKNKSHVDNLVIWGFATNEELKCLLDNCKAFIFPTLYEGFGLPIAEALSRGTKIVCNYIEPSIEVGGDDLYYFKNKDELVNILKNIETMNQKTVTRCYHWTDVAKDYINEYKSI